MGQRGPARLPVALRLLNNNPGRRYENEPELIAPSGIPEPPTILIEEAKQEWDRIAPSLEAMGVLSHLDLAALATYCQAYGRWIVAEKRAGSSDAIILSKGTKKADGTIENQEIIQNPLINAARRAMKDLTGRLNSLGLTPAIRAKFYSTEEEGDFNQNFSNRFKEKRA